jgi:hypothetical protein
MYRRCESSEMTQFRVTIATKRHMNVNLRVICRRGAGSLLVQRNFAYILLELVIC